jgi:hypothetical protein
VTGEPGAVGRRIASVLQEVTLEKVAAVGLENARRNQPLIARGKSIDALVGAQVGRGDAALVVAAGPSIHRHDQGRLLKASRFEGALIATESSLSWCLRQELVPDLVVTLDPHAERIVRWFGDPTLDEQALQRDDYYARQDMDPRFARDQLANNRELLALVDRWGPRLKIAISSSASEAVVRRAHEAGMDVYWWNPLYDDPSRADGLTRQALRMNGLPCVNAGGNVGAACWVFAHAVLGKRRVGLVGIDLGYYAETPYSKTQYYKELVALLGEERLDEAFVRIVNPHLGQAFYTDPAYLWYRDAFLEMAAAADCETHNCTGGGILFGEPIRWTPLPEFLTLTGGR